MSTARAQPEIYAETDARSRWRRRLTAASVGVYRRKVPRLRALAVIVLASLAAAPARAETPEEQVERLAADAITAYKGADYHRAVELLKRAYDIRQVPALLYNLGKAYDKLGDIPHAIDAYSRYAASDGSDSALKAKAEARLLLLRSRSQLQEQPQTQAQPQTNTQPQTRTQPRTQTELQTQTQALMQPQARTPSRDRAVAIALGSGTLAFATVAIALSASALSLEDQYHRSTDYARKSQLRTDAVLRANIADGFYAATAATAVVTTVFIWRAVRREHPRPAVSVAPALSPSSAALLVQAPF
jgi:tetratricopeptide (TPR) repeat protein